ncbi:hypothetical protein BJ138DRAFT_1114909 [Hygrophoropsis aurantiaca]|uniref:Uncharacterized protein n=1 Tax=Hygrophoropsis aurantiaca TaxID=72124 RepID=A0ACB8A8Y0_9AGAM|nr:hypothetical protein BJ138DRAFT_1114909 [Hygrophoropsis aurantiaca]
MEDTVDAKELARVLSEKRCVEKEEEFERVRQALEGRQKIQLSAYDDDEKIEASFMVHRGFNDKYTLLLWRDSGAEVVLDVQGYIASMMVPPLSAKRHSNWRNPLALKQNVTLVGVTPKFASACSALERLYRFFEQGFGRDQLRKWQLTTVGSSLPAITSSTRFVSPVAELDLWPNGLPLLTDDKDRENVIRQWVGEGKAVLTEDNVVSYTEVKFDDGRLQRRDIDPSLFRGGHLVEMGLSVRAVENRDHSPVQHSFLVHLDSLFLHNRMVTKVWFNINISSQLPRIRLDSNIKSSADAEET